MKKRFMKLVSCMLVVSIVLSTIATIPVMAGNRASNLATPSMTTLIPNTWADWKQAIYKDFHHWNYFHNKVQNEIRSLYSKLGKKELTINGVGRADLFMESDKETFIWEVKPASYGKSPKRELGLKQLQKYVNSNAKFKIGDDTIKGGSFISGKYKITYVNAQNGLILYRFDRTSKPEPEPEPAPVPVPVLVPAPAHEETGKEVTDNAMDIWNSAIRLGPVAYAMVCVVVTAMDAIHKKTPHNSISATVCSYSAMFFAGEISPGEYMELMELLFGEDLRLELEKAILQNDSKRIDELMKEIKEESKDFNNAIEAQPPRDPLAIDLGASEIGLTTLENGVYFDLDKNGFAERTSWIGPEDGFLVLDRNDDGKINDGGELFGDQVTLENGLTSSSGFQALSEFDKNNDNVIDINDPIFIKLKVWIDSNQNGISEAHELKDLEKLGVISISLRHTEVTLVDPKTGTRISETADITIMKNEVATTTAISEFWFPIKAVDTEHDGETTVGNVPNIVQAITKDSSGELLGLCLEFSETDDIGLMRYYLKKILYYVTDATDVPINSRGGNIDARDLKVIEKFMGREFVGIGGKNPNAPAAAILKKLYTNIEDQYFNIINLQVGFGGYMKSAYELVDENGQKKIDLSFFNYIIDSKISNGENVDTLVYSLGVYLRSFDNINDTNAFNDYSTHYASLSSHYSQIVEYSKSGSTFIGVDGKDNYSGTNHNDFVFGENGDDSLNGGNGNDILYGGNGNDTINGGNGSDTIVGGKGDDILIGGSGSNIYKFSKDDGYDILRSSVGADDTLKFININSTDITLCKDPNNPDNLLAAMLNADDIITIENYFGNNLKQIEFANGDILDRAAIENWTTENPAIIGNNAPNMLLGQNVDDVLIGGKFADFLLGNEGDDKLFGWDGSDYLNGNDGNDWLNGGDGDDSLYGGNGNDTLIGGEGNDSLYGELGNDNYIFGHNFGSNIIEDNDGENKLVFKYFTSDSIIITNENENLEITLKGITDKITIKNFLSPSINFVFEFADGKIAILNKETLQFEGDLN